MLKIITVRIDGPENGSGAIVGKRGNTYTVLTNCHAIETPGTYTIVTHTGRRYRVNANQDMCQPGIDLAMLRFTSTRRYRVANLGDSLELVVGRKVYVSGWVARNIVNSEEREEREYRFRDGNIADFTLVRYTSQLTFYGCATLRDWHKSVVASECCTSPD